MKLTIKEINQQVVPQIQRMAQANPGAQSAIEAFFQQYGRIYEDERFKTLSAQIDENKKLLRELEMKEALRGNIAKLEDTISKLDYEFSPVPVAGEVPPEIRTLFPAPAQPKVVEEGPVEVPHPLPEDAPIAKMVAEHENPGMRKRAKK